MHFYRDNYNYLYLTEVTGHFSEELILIKPTCFQERGEKKITYNYNFIGQMLRRRRFETLAQSGFDLK